MTKAVLLDLGNVVLGVDFRRVFARWAQLAGVDEQRFYDNWMMDEAYRAHEVGEITFGEYCDSLGRRFELELTHAQWQEGWNALWTQPFHSVVALLPEVASRYSLYAFTNTNDTHAMFWRQAFASELDHFEHIFVSSEIGLRKPDESAFAHVCSQIEHDPNDVLFLDDTAENVAGARRSGLAVHHVNSEHAAHQALRTLLDS